MMLGIRVRSTVSVWQSVSVLTVSAIGTVIGFIIAPSALAEPLDSTAREITVRIDGPTADGSGVIVERNEDDTYTVLTNWHVIDEEGDYDIITNDGEAHYAHYDYFQRIEGFDLAVIFFNSSNDYQVADLGSDSSNLALGQTVFAAGWLNPSSQFSQHRYRFIQGSLSGVEDIPNEEGYALSFSAPGAFVGTSGGPLLNQQGQVIGILGSGEKDANGKFTGLYLGLPIDLYLASGIAVSPSVITPDVLRLGGDAEWESPRPGIITPSFAPGNSRVCSGYARQC